MMLNILVQKEEKLYKLTYAVKSKQHILQLMYVWIFSPEFKYSVMMCFKSMEIYLCSDNEFSFLYYLVVLFSYWNKGLLYIDS